MALTNDRETKPGFTGTMDNLKKAATVIYGGSLLNRLSSDGKVQPGADTASTTFGGVAVKRALAADTHAESYTEGVHYFIFGAGSATAALVGTVVCVNGEDTVDVAGTTTNDVLCGIIREVVDATHVRVCIDGYVK